MQIFEMKMPPMGEGIMECTVLNWLKKPGEAVEADESIVEVATDKVDTEIPSPKTGLVLEWLVKEGEVVSIGGVLAKLEVKNKADVKIKDDTENASESPDELEAAEILENDIKQATVQIIGPKTFPQVQGKNSGFYSPLVQTIAKEEGLSSADLAEILGSGEGNRLTKNDILAFISNRKLVATNGFTKETLIPNPLASDEVVEMNRVRKMIAQRMLESKNTAAHVTSFIESDVTGLVQWRNSIKVKFSKKYGEAITFTPLLILAVAKAIRAYPAINATVSGDKIFIKKDINIGMAVALPDGNLIVPVVHNADRLSLPDLSKKVNDLAARARKNKLQAAEVTGGTYTISNIGTFGNLMGTPIILQPQIAIMAFGAIKKKPTVIESPLGDSIAIRSQMFISHSYDHRVVDGSLGGLFLKAVSDNLEKFDPNTSID